MLAKKYSFCLILIIYRLFPMGQAPYHNIYSNTAVPLSYPHHQQTYQAGQPSPRTPRQLLYRENEDVSRPLSCKELMLLLYQQTRYNCCECLNCLFCCCFPERDYDDVE